MARALILLGLLAIGCGDEPVVSIAEWTLSSDGRALSLPARFHDRVPPRAHRYTLSTTIEVPSEWRGRPLALTIPFFQARPELRVAGRSIARQESRADLFRRTGDHFWRIPAELTATERLSIDLVVPHEWIFSAHLDTLPTLSPRLDGDARYRRVAGFNRVVLAAAPLIFVVLALVYAAIYLLDRRRVAHGWFALHDGAALVFALYLSGAIVDAAPGWAFVFGTVGAATFGPSLHAFTYAEFSLGRVPRWIPISSIVVIALRVAAGPDPFLTKPWVMWATIAQAIACVVFGVVVYARLWRREESRRIATMFAAVYLIVAVFALSEALIHVGPRAIFDGMRVFLVAIALFGIAQAVGLGMRHLTSLRRAEELNVELRRQIADRSRQLSDALALMESGKPTPRVFHAGDVIEGRYRVVAHVGAGGMGSVYEVTRITDGRRLALKVMSGRADAGALARFAREAQIAASLDHPNLVSVVDIDVSRAGGLFLVMEYVDGSSLKQAHARYGQREWAVPILRQVAEGLAAIHAHGIVHRDLKPANILLGDGVVKIADFGVASLRRVSSDESVLARATTVSRGGAGSPELTRSGMMLGTPLYMAPELADGAKDPEPSSDLYSFGVIAHEVCAGRRPLSDRDLLARLEGIATDDPEPLARRCAGIDVAFAELADRCLATDPSRRPTAREIADALNRSRSASR